MTYQNILFQEGVIVTKVHQELQSLNHLQLYGIAILQGKKNSNKQIQYIKVSKFNHYPTIYLLLQYHVEQSKFLNFGTKNAPKTYI